MLKQYFKLSVKILFVCFMISIGYAVWQEHVLDQQVKLAKSLETKSAKSPMPAPPPPPVGGKDVDSLPKVAGAEIEVFSVIKVKLDDNDSWNLVFKMLSLTLGTFFGIRLINFGFRKFE